jgi:hypothetical protein
MSVFGSSVLVPRNRYYARRVTKSLRILMLYKPDASNHGFGSLQRNKISPDVSPRFLLSTAKFIRKLKFFGSGLVTFPGVSPPCSSLDWDGQERCRLCSSGRLRKPGEEEHLDRLKYPLARQVRVVHIEPLAAMLPGERCIWVIPSGLSCRKVSLLSSKPAHRRSNW